jgi:hypothetical protein
MKHLHTITAIASLSYGLGACTPKVKEKIVYVEVIREVERLVQGGEKDSEGRTIENSVVGTEVTAPLALVSTNLQVSGQLVVAAGSINTGAALRSFSLVAVDDKAYSIYCTTFETNPSACAATVTDGVFDKSCENYAGKTFGCFLREGLKTLTTIEFGGNTSLVTGAGALVSKITYDSDTGLARAKIDEEMSSALAPDAIAAAMKAQGVETTTLPVMTGLWKTDCVNSPAEGSYCDPKDDPKYSTDVDVTKKYCKAPAEDYWYYDYATSQSKSKLTSKYFECAEGTTGVNVPEGYCYDQWLMPTMAAGNMTAGTLTGTSTQRGGYVECMLRYGYCFDDTNTQMQTMPECVAARKVTTKDPLPTKLFLSEYTDSVKDESKIAVWKDAASRNACISTGYSEAKPAFGLKLGTATSAFNFFPFNLSAKPAMDASIDDAIDRMAKWSSGSEIQDYKFVANKLISLGSNRESWKVQQCKNSPYGDSANPPQYVDGPDTDTDTTGPDTDTDTQLYTYHKCQFRLEEINTYTWEDWSTGEPKTISSSYPTWWWDTDEFRSNSSGKWSVDAPTGLETQDVQCTSDAADGSGLPFCPPFASTAGIFQQYHKMVDGKKARLMLVCMVDQTYNYGSGVSHYYFLQQTPSPSNTMSTAISTMDASSGCGAVYPATGGHALAGLPKIQVEAIRRVAGELALSKNFEFDSSKLCHGVDVDSSWDFNRCDSGKFGEAGYQLCWGQWAFSSVLGLAKSGGVYTRDGQCADGTSDNEVSCTSKAPNVWTVGTGLCSNPSFITEASCITNNTWTTALTTTVNSWDMYFFESCAQVDSSVKTALDAYNTAANADPSTLTAAHQAKLVRSCRDALMAGGTTSAQLATEVSLARGLAMRWEWMPTKAIACSGSTDTRNKVLNGLAASCMADASLNMFCDFSGNCMSSLRCNGSKDGGKCFKDGEFIGNIPGRMGFMDLKLRTDGAFELNELVQDRWNQWNFTKNKNETCETTRNMLVNSQKKSDTEFEGMLKTTEKMDCVVDEKAGATGAAPGGAAGTVGTQGAAGAGGSAQATNFDRAKMGDTLQKLRFRKCADLTCSEYPAN